LRQRLNRTWRWIWGGSEIVVILALLGSVAVDALPQTPVPFSPSPEIKAVVDGNTRFALDLYQQLRSREGNLFFSPFSASTGLAMAGTGARGQTAVEMTNVLHLALPPEKLSPAFQGLLARLDQVQRGNRVVLKTANAIWCQQSIPWRPDFLSRLQQDYGAAVKSVDFGNSPAAAAAEINHWIEVQTGHRVSGHLTPDELASGTGLLLCDAIYFKGKWLHSFERKDTRPAPFYVTTNETVTVPMMFQKGRFRFTFSEDGTVQMLELPYVGEDLSMVILMPSPLEYLPEGESADLSNLEQKLTVENLHAWLKCLDEVSAHDVLVRLPRFSTASSFQLTGTLKDLGLSGCFSERADFSGMDGTKNLYLSKVVQEAFVQVDETGTTAAAVTFGSGRTAAQELSITVDHPFVFLIRENGSGSVLFLGRIIDPTR
jgi:serpin B